MLFVNFIELIRIENIYKVINTTNNYRPFSYLCCNIVMFVNSRLKAYYQILSMILILYSNSYYQHGLNEEY